MGGEPRWSSVRLDDVEPVPFRDRDLRWHPVRSALGARVAGMSVYTAVRAGQEIVEPHVESRDGRGHEELYVVLRGRTTFTLDGERLDAPAGTFVLVREPDVHRAAVAEEPGTAVLAIGGDPVFQPAASEWIDRARPFLASDPERARTILDELPADVAGAPVARRYGEALLAAAQDDREGARAALRAALARSRDPDAVREQARGERLLAGLIGAVEPL